MDFDLTILYTSIHRESSQPDTGTVLLDEIETIEAQVAELTAQGVNKIIVLTHIGYKQDQDWIAGIDGVDVVVGGDSHSLLGDDKTAAIASRLAPMLHLLQKQMVRRLVLCKPGQTAKRSETSMSTLMRTAVLSRASGLPCSHSILRK